MLAIFIILFILSAILTLAFSIFYFTNFFSESPEINGYKLKVTRNMMIYCLIATFIFGAVISIIS